MRHAVISAMLLLVVAHAAHGQQFDPNREYELEIVTWTADVKTEGLTWEWLVREYQRFRPNVRIRKEVQSNRTYESWATTQFKSGFAPDIMQSFPWKAHQWGAEQGMLVPLRKYLNRPNPHDHRDPKRYPTWMSCLYEELLEQNADPYYGEIWTIPISLNTQRFYYNKRLFNLYGVKPPTTFTGLGDVCRTITEKSAGAVAPIAMPQTGAWLDYLGAGVNMDLIDRYDLIQQDATITQTEMLVGALRGMWDANTDAMYSFHDLLKKMNDEGWFQEGWAGFDQNQADNLFTNQRAAIIREGYWMKEGFEQRIAGEFEFGVMKEPYIDRQFAGRDIGHMLELMASYGSELAITRRCEERGRLPAALDFLQWMTSPEVAIQVAQHRGAMPSTRDLDQYLPDNIKAFKPVIGGKPGGPLFYPVSRKYRDCFNQVVPLYVSGKWEKDRVKRFMGRLHNRFIQLAVDETTERTRRGIFKAAQLYAGFLYRAEDLRRLAAKETDPVRRDDLVRGRTEALNSIGMTLDNLKTSEDTAVALVDTAWPGQGADGFRHVPLIGPRRQKALELIGSVLIVVARVAGIVLLLRKGRLARILAVPEKTIYLFIVPTLVCVLVFRYYPALSGIYHAFTRWDGVTVDEFIGLANFKELLSDQVLWTAALNLLWMLGAFFVKLVPPLIIAVILYHVASERLRYYFRVMFVVPLVVPGIVYWMVWKLLYKPAPTGVFNSILLPIEQWLQAHGWNVELAYNWLADPRTALGAIIFLGFPWINTLGVLIYLAGLENIDPNLFEAAEMDGAGAIKKFWHVELPLLARQIKLNLVLGLIATIQGFGTILFLTKGGPAYATTVPGYQMYDEAFTLGRMGYASAIGLLMFVVILIATMTTGRAVKPQY